MNSAFQNMNMDMEQIGGQAGGTLGPQLQGKNNCSYPEVSIETDPIYRPI
jgi:hypothetical protein